MELSAAGVPAAESIESNSAERRHLSSGVFFSIPRIAYFYNDTHFPAWLLTSLFGFNDWLWWW